MDPREPDDPQEARFQRWAGSLLIVASIAYLLLGPILDYEPSAPLAGVFLSAGVVLLGVSPTINLMGPHK
jgi:hypothetical protein